MNSIRTLIPALAGALWCAAVSCEPVDPTVKETPITILSEHEGYGRPAKAGDMVTIKYRLSTPEGREILDDDEYLFELGSGSVIAGVDEAVTGMNLRSKRTVKCPPHKHWGRPGYGDGAIPPDTILILEVEVLRIDQKAPRY